MDTPEFRIQSTKASMDMFDKVTHNNLPEAISALHRKFDLLLTYVQGNNLPDEKDKCLNIEQLIDYLPEHPARQTIYGCVNLRCVPYEKHGKRLYFRKSDIDSWLANGRKVK